jgi:amino-acid N-acetyltransferase
VSAIASTKKPGSGQKKWLAICLKVTREKTAVKHSIMEARIIDQSELLNDVLSLLKNNKLPYQDIQLDNSLFVSYHDNAGTLVGSGGLEFYSSYALLRSLAVDESHRGKSLGKEIVNDLLMRAKSRSVREIFLLTETAHDFFLKRGFKDLSRENVPEIVRLSSEFKSVCPSSAACMVYRF